VSFEEKQEGEIEGLIWNKGGGDCKIKKKKRTTKRERGSRRKKSDIFEEKVSLGLYKGVSEGGPPRSIPQGGVRGNSQSEVKLMDRIFGGKRGVDNHGESGLGVSSRFDQREGTTPRWV